MNLFISISILALALTLTSCERSDSFWEEAKETEFFKLKKLKNGAYKMVLKTPMGFIDKPFYEIEGEVFFKNNIIYCKNSKGNRVPLFNFNLEFMYFEDFIHENTVSIEGFKDFTINIGIRSISNGYEVINADTVYKFRFAGLGIRPSRSSHHDTMWHDWVLYVSKKRGVVGAYLSKDIYDIIEYDGCCEKREFIQSYYGVDTAALKRQGIIFKRKSKCTMY